MPLVADRPHAPARPAAARPARGRPPAEPPTAGRGTRAWRLLGPAVALAVLALALVALQRELAGTHYHALARAVRAVSGARLALAVALTALAYVVLSGYDALALAFVGARLPRRRVMAASAAAYAVSQTLGFAALTGSAVRGRLWSAWGLTAATIGQAVGFIGVTFTLGLLLTSGTALVASPSSTLALLGVAPALARTVGGLALAVVAGYVSWCAVRRGRPIAVRGWAVPVPRARLAIAQLALAGLDWTVAASVLYVLLPPTPSLAFLPFVGVFAVAQCAGLISHVPGGLGVFDALVVVALRSVVPAERTMAALVLYRAVYYLLPFGTAVTAFGVAEARRQRERIAAAAGATGVLVARWGEALLPTMLSVTTFLGGALLLASGATPSAHGRVRALAAVLPLGVIELSHFAGSVAGVGLLVLAWAIGRRLDAAYALTVGLLAIGIVASLLKGLDYEEALALGAALAVVLPSRRAFYRRAALTSEPLTPAWLAAVVAVVGASVWLGLFSYQHVEYDADLWWRFAVRDDAPRFLRASAGAVAALLALGTARLLRRAAVKPARPDAAALTRAAAVAGRSGETLPRAALLGDKALLFSDDGAGFVMYGVSGRSWVALGDPVVPADEPPARAAERRAELAWRFREAADRAGAWPVFYQVRAEQLPLYVDLGLGFLKLGEEALVPLARFAPGARAESKWMRRALRDGEQHGLRFEVVAADAVPALVPELRAISDDWLADRVAREKGFSLGRYDDAYVARGPVALVREHDRPVAFANVWLAAPGTEMAPDLMRHTHDATRGVMDYLFVQLLRWGAAQGYARASLGMAPLAGLEARRLAPLWARAGALIAARGEHFYNFAGLRAFKEKFDPVWEPRYLASPGGLALPRVLANVTALVSGGLTGVVRK